jgi:signal peptidase II
MLFFLTALLVAAADQLTKTWIRSYAQGQVIFKAGLFSIIHTNNSGAAFGILQDQSFFLTIAGFVGILLILLFVFVVSHRSPFLVTAAGKLALGLVLGGTIGNLTDRLRFGHVTDFIGVSIWPTFNIADSAVTTGVILFACLFLFSTRDKEPLPGVPEEQAGK